MRAHLVKNEVFRLLNFVEEVHIKHPKSGETHTIKKSSYLRERDEWKSIRNDWMMYLQEKFNCEEFVVSYLPL